MVLVIDNDIDILEFYVELLNDFGLKGAPHTSPQSALEYFSKNPDMFWLVITELSCTRKYDGLWLAEQTRLAARTTPVLLVTDMDLPAHLDPNLFYSIINKSDSFKELSRHIREIIKIRG